MKKSITTFLFLSVFFITFKFGYSQTYSLTARNMQLNNPTDNALEFDIYILRTGATPLDYAAGRYNFYFNPLIANGGTLTYSIIPGSSALPVAYQPFGPSITGDRLNMIINPFPGSGFIISNIAPGTKVCRVKLETSASVFAIEPFALSWNNPGSTNPPRTVVYAYNSDGDEINITTPLTHSIDSSGLGGVLPVELASFSSTIYKNNVILNWSTTKEINNSGFDLERKTKNGTWTKITFINGNGTNENTSIYTFTDRGLSSENYNYRLKQIDFNGNFEYFNLNNEVNVGAPNQFILAQNYPNPFNPSTVINYEIPLGGNVNIKLFDVSGKELNNLINEFKQAGYYSVSFNGSNLSSGTYFYRIIVESAGQNFVTTKKMVLTK